MQPNDVRLLRDAVIPTALAGLAAVLIAAFTTGVTGAVGAAMGVFLVAFFFSIGLFVVSWASRISPQMMMVAAILSYAVKFVVIAVSLQAFKDVSIWHPKAFAWTVVACTVVWLAAEARAFMKTRMLYVEPGTQVPGMKDGP
ncbi:hypothetical protein [Rhizohabitans arisaemae]|uniref:hypothetical protein n=1 Tax=Rhizohabitans arisaemae TaxID=2720610 RepID=UPI0024B16A55|nr:hypothetical protein [Rhizohabitans arisaemae]